MAKKITATAAKNNFGGLLEDVAALGCVEIVRHGRVVAVMFSPQALQSLGSADSDGSKRDERNHMIPARLARAARMVSAPSVFDED